MDLLLRNNVPAGSAAWPCVGCLSAAVLPSLLLLELLALALSGPFLLNDGPVHVSMAIIPAQLDAAGHWLQQRLFERNPVLSPNLTGGLILAFLLPITGAEAAESTLQALCLVSIPLAGWVALSQVSLAARWLAVLLVPLGFTQMFFYGLYNFVLSIAGFFLAVGAHLAWRRAPSIARALLLLAALLFTLACHAAGFIMACVAVAAMTGVDAGVRLLRGERPFVVLRRHAPVLLACAPPAGLFLAFLAQSAGSTIEYGGSPLVRVVRILTLRQLGMNGAHTWVVGCMLTLLVGLMACAALVRLRRRWLAMEADEQLRAACLWSLPVAFLLVALVIPDVSGGGWTHAWRAELFPYLGLVLALATVPLQAVPRAVVTGWAGGISFALLGFAVFTQAVHVRPAMAELMKADAAIGQHCTVLPVIFEWQPTDVAGNTRQIGYSPFFQAAQRLELRGDRVVLFNYLARLAVYPLAFRRDADPAELLFHWRPEQADPETRVLDIPRFEARTGLRVDYVLVWGTPTTPRQALWTELQARLREGYTPVAFSVTGRMRLFRRTGASGGCESPALG